MRRFDVPRVDMGPLLKRLRPMTAAATAQSRKLWAKLQEGESTLAKYPALAKGAAAGVAVWHRMVEEFCGVIDPLLARAFPQTRLVAVVTTSSDVELHKVTTHGVLGLGAWSALDDAAKAGLAAEPWSTIELRLREDQVLQRSLTLPTASRGFLEPIIEHRLERLTPWRTDKVLYGYRVIEERSSATSVDIALLATSKDIVDGVTRSLAEGGLVPGVIGIGGSDLALPVTVNLRKGGGGMNRAKSRAMVSRVALAVIGVLAVAYFVSASVATNAIDGQETAEARLVKARRLLKSAALANVTGPERALLAAQQPGDSILVLIDRLAEEIPQDTYLKELSATPETVRLVGTSMNAPALIGKLEAAGLANVRFSSAVTRQPDQKDNFEITADRPDGHPTEEPQAR